jgi:hypothetical protein
MVTARGQPMRISDYPNTPTLGTNYLFIVAVPGYRGYPPIPGTNYNITWGQLQALMTNLVFLPSGNGSLLTNLTYRYTTNSMTNASCIWGAEVFTNIGANFTLNIPPPDPYSFETAVVWVTNGFGVDYKITLPAGVWGTPGSGTPPVYYCTNKMLTRILVEHHAYFGTNAYKLDFAP